MMGRRRGSIDYIVDTLIHSNFENVNKIINGEVENIFRLYELLKKILYAKE